MKDLRKLIIKVESTQIIDFENYPENNGKPYYIKDFSELPEKERVPYFNFLKRNKEAKLLNYYILSK